jgi:class 3 adenylate cyclase
LKTFLVVSESSNQTHLDFITGALDGQTEIIHYSELGLINNLNPDIFICVCDESNYKMVLDDQNYSLKLKKIPKYVFFDSWNTEVLKQIYTFDVSGHFIPEEIFVMSRELERVFEYRDLQRKMMEMKIEMEHNQRLLSTYVSSDIIEKNSLANAHIDKGGEILQATILIFDIRQSTSIAETIHPDIFSAFLSDLLSDIMDLIYGHSGHVNKMLGDGLLATFGCPTSSGNDPLNAVECALQIREYLKTYNDVRPDYIPFPIQAGVGIATGKVFAGDIGSVRKTEYTVLGDCVNTASRIESMTKKAGVDILIDGHTFKHTSEKIKVQKVNYKNIRGKRKIVDIYFLKGLKTDF